MAEISNQNPWLLLGLFAVIGGFYILALKHLSIRSGWARLAKRCPARSLGDGTSFESCSVESSKGGSYGRQVRVALDEDALHLAMHPPARIFHRAISIPWGEIAGFASHPWQGSQRGISFAGMDLVFYMDEKVIAAAEQRWKHRAGTPE